MDMGENREAWLEDVRKNLIGRLIARTRKESINSMKAEDMARRMEISKVTMYKYFSSKDEILAMVVRHYKAYIHREAAAVTESEDSFIRKYQKSFELSLFLNYYFPESFINDFKQYSPNLYGEILDAHQFRIDRLAAFYKSGAEQGVFFPVNAAIFILNEELVLRCILEPPFLISNGLSLEKTLNDYYDMNKRMLIRQEYLKDMDDAPMKDVFMRFVCKHSRNI